jgi:hypothetical protein
MHSAWLVDAAIGIGFTLKPVADLCLRELDGNLAI